MDVERIVTEIKQMDNSNLMLILDNIELCKILINIEYRIKELEEFKMGVTELVMEGRE